jgi:hypothetical protein
MDPEDKKAIPRRQSKPRAKISAAEQAEVSELIRTAFVQYQEDIEKQRLNQKGTDIEFLDGMISEHTGPYMLIGFNLNNEPIEIFSAKNAMEALALSELFKRAFADRAVKSNMGFL